MDNANDLIRIVAIDSVCALIPKHNPAIKVLADDRILGRGREHVADKVERLLGCTGDGAVKQFGHHRTHGPSTCRIVVTAGRSGGG